MKKHMFIMLACLGVLFGAITGWYFFKQHMIAQFIHKMQQATATVSVVTAKKEIWSSSLTATGSLLALHGVNVTTQASGIVSQIQFISGSLVKKNQVLVILDDRKEQANVANYQAQLVLAQQNFYEISALFRVGATSKNAREVAQANLETARANLRLAQVELDYLHIPAPFDGKIGIRAIDLGQYIQPGVTIAALQQLNPLRVQFSIAQQQVNQITLGQRVEVRVDSHPGHVYSGEITAMDSQADPETRNIQVQATLENDDLKILPGMFAHIAVILRARQPVIALPQTAINYNLFGDSVYLALPDGKTPQGKEQYVIELRYVTLGENHRHQVAIRHGLSGGELVVSSGQLKVSAGTHVTLNNSIQP